MNTSKNSTSIFMNISAAITAVTALATGLTGLVAGAFMIRQMFLMLYFQQLQGKFHIPGQALQHFLLALAALLAYLALSGAAVASLNWASRINWAGKGALVLYAVLYGLAVAGGLFFLLAYLVLGLVFGYAFIERGDGILFLLMAMGAIGLGALGVATSEAIIKLAFGSKLKLLSNLK